MCFTLLTFADMNPDALSQGYHYFYKIHHGLVTILTEDYLHPVSRTNLYGHISSYLLISLPYDNLPLKPTRATHLLTLEQFDAAACQH